MLTGHDVGDKAKFVVSSGWTMTWSRAAWLATLPFSANEGGPRVITPVPLFTAEQCKQNMNPPPD